jgi:hypothetical protein
MTIYDVFLAGDTECLLLATVEFFVADGFSEKIEIITGI